MTWQNWAGTATADPAQRYWPRSTEEIADAIKDAAAAGLTVRALGSGHSFTPTAATSGAALDLSGWAGVISADADSGLVRVRSGTTIRQLNAALDVLGLAMPNLGDIDAQTIAGAISTGTHGTGARLGGIAAAVAELELVLADGSVVSCSPQQRPDLFAAAQVGLGALGVISTVTLKCVPAFDLSADERPMPLGEVLERFGEFAASNDHFEFYWFPYGKNALVKRNNRGTELPRMPAWRHFFEYEVMENAAFGALCRTGRAVPALVKPLNRFAASTLSKRVVFRPVAPGVRDPSPGPVRRVGVRGAPRVAPRRARRTARRGAAARRPGDVPRRGPRRGRRRHLAVHRLRQGHRLRGDPPVRGTAVPGIFPRARIDRGRRRRPPALGQDAYARRRAAR